MARPLSAPKAVCWSRIASRISTGYPHSRCGIVWPMGRPRYRYEPEEAGWIGISNPWGFIAYIDCRQGGAQRAFTELCQSFERAGWQLEGRKFDWQFVNKGNMRWEIRIGVL